MSRLASPVAFHNALENFNDVGAECERPTRLHVDDVVSTQRASGEPLLSQDWCLLDWDMQFHNDVWTFHLQFLVLSTNSAIASKHIIDRCSFIDWPIPSGSVNSACFKIDNSLMILSQHCHACKHQMIAADLSFVWNMYACAFLPKSCSDQTHNNQYLSSLFDDTQY